MVHMASVRRCVMCLSHGVIHCCRDSGGVGVFLGSVSVHSRQFLVVLTDCCTRCVAIATSIALYCCMGSCVFLHYPWWGAPSVTKRTWWAHERRMLAHPRSYDHHRKHQNDWVTDPEFDCQHVSNALFMRLNLSVG